MSGLRAFDRQPVASTTNFAVTVLPSEVVTDQILSRSSKAQAFTRRVELDVRTQVEAVGDMVGVAQDFRLRRVALAPVPFLLQLVGEGIGILHALDVAACAGIAVPVPGAADAPALLVDAHRKALPAQPVQHVHAAKARADHDDVVGLGAVAAAEDWADIDENSRKILLDLSASILSAARKRKRSVWHAKPRRKRTFFP